MLYKKPEVIIVKIDNDVILKISTEEELNNIDKIDPWA